MYKIKLKNESIFHDKIKKKQPKTLMSIKYLFAPSHYCNFAMMKHLYILLLSGYLLIGFAACKQHRPYNDQLAHIDSLADVNPDSADVLLIYTPSPSQKGGEKEVWELLRIKIDDKLYRPVTHYRDTILQLIDYFERHPRVLPRLLGSTGPALPYLYAGRIYSDLGDAPQALDYYQRALDVMPVGQIENGEWKIENEETRRLAKQRGLLHSFIGTQLYYQGLYRDALCQYNDARRYDMYASDTIGVIYDLRDAAEQYKYLSLNDSSLLLYRNALQLSQQCNNGHLCRVVQSQIARLYIAKGDYELAHQYILPAINHIDTVDISSTYALASVIYKNIGDADSALYCYNKLLQYGNVTGKSLAFKELAAIATKKRDPSLALHYLSQYSLLIDSIRKMDNAETVARMHAAYNYQKHEREAHELRLSNAMKEKVIYVTILSLILLLVVVLWLRSMLKIHRTKLEESRRAHEDLQRKFSLLTEDYEKKLEQANLRLKESTDEEERNALTQQRDQILYHTTLSRLEKEKIEAKTRSIHATELFKKILSTPSYLRSTKGAWSDVEKIISEHYPEFMDHLSQLLPKLSEKERQVSLLLKAHIGHQTIADIICETQNGESNIRRRLCKKVFPKETPSSSKFDDFIDSL